MRHPEHQMQSLGIFVHGVLTGLHALGFVYNWKRRNWFDVCAHGLAASYSLSATAKHVRALETCDVQVRIGDLDRLLPIRNDDLS